MQKLTVYQKEQAIKMLEGGFQSTRLQNNLTAPLAPFIFGNPNTMER
ncbi:MAG: hypothetical protein FWD86_00535 [Firmicutes bacterium]|nr:hypothetical protein [Bacillota bacterium]